MGREMLLERERELSAIRDRLDLAADGDGSLIVIEGPAGIGKTRLLEATRMRAGARGLEVLTARGSELERDFPFGIVRQLFEPALAEFSAETRAELLAGGAAPGAALFDAGDATAGSAAEDLLSTLHGLYWVCANLAAEGPLLVVVDDAHWADPASLRWLHFVARRLEGLPVLVVLALRSAESASGGSDLHAIRRDHATLAVEPRPLSADAVAELVRATLDSESDDAVCGACHDTTGGNPFLLAELMATIVKEQATGGAPSPERVLTLGTAGVSRSVLARLARLPDEAVALTHALAVLGGEAELALAAGLAELEGEATIVAADALARDHILTNDATLAFVHPLVRASILDDLPRLERTRLHARAARLLAGRGAGTEAIAVHVLAADPAGDPWVVDRLRRAASRALATGAADAAVRHLRRALAEPPSDTALPGVLHELGRAEAASFQPEAEDRLVAAAEAAPTPAERAGIELELGRVLALRDPPEGAIEALDRGIEAALAAGDRELALRLEAEGIAAAATSTNPCHLAAPRADRLIADVSRGETPGERLALAGIAWERAVQASAPADAVAEMAERALAEGDLLSIETGDALTLHVAAGALAVCDRLERAHRYFTDVLAAANRARAATAFSTGSYFRSWVAYRRGALTDAEADARAALKVAEDHELAVETLSFAILLTCLLARGQLAEAAEALERWGDVSTLPDSAGTGRLLMVRGKLRALSGEPAGALEDLRACGRLYEAAGIRNPSLGPWRSSCATILHALGEEDEARALVGEELEIARAFGAPRVLGVALRGAGTVTPGREGVDLLAEAVDVLEGSEVRLELAVSLHRLGDRLARAGQPKEAREPLRQALDLAHRCGATMLADAARAALLEAGGRPRRTALTGVDALTPSELRIARLAADGLSNREIAEHQFLTLRGVEVNLSRAYRKLSISSRAELPRKLGEIETGSAPAESAAVGSA